MFSTPTARAYRDAVHDTWEAAVRHRFVSELADGIIADDVLAGYLVQDYQFCENFIALLGQGVASADRYESRLVFARQVGFVATAEDTYFRDCFDLFGVSERDRVAPELRPATAGFADLMGQVRDSRDYARILVLLVVAEGLYLDWAERASDAGAHLPERPEHRGWFDLHRGADFSAWVRWLEEELDRVADPEDAELAALFARAVTLEWEFFEDTYTA